ncbi:MAG: GTP cyclohydrolase I FolE [Clostridia bacterium]|nr:GTP cyclohydrolase I FolE [Clostridia bacterium]
MPLDREQVAAAIRLFLTAIGEDVDRPGLRGTPERVARACEELFYGVGRDPADEVNVFFQEEHDEMVLVRDIPFFSLCEHHLLPFIGRAHVAYIPRNGRITGLSKLARVVEVAARRPQLQERLTTQVADALMRRLEPSGVLVVVEAEHLCMTMRGIRKPGSLTVTSAVRGVFARVEKTRAEAMALIRKHG